MNTHPIKRIYIFIFSLTLYCCDAQSSFESIEWNAFLEENSFESIVAISNGNSHCSPNNKKGKRLIMVLFLKGGHWYTQKLKWNGKKIKVSKCVNVSIENENYVESKLSELIVDFESLVQVDNHIPGSFVELFYQDFESKIVIPYLNAGGRGDINGFIDSEYNLIFSFYSLINNNCW